MEMWIGNTRYEIRFGYELEAALHDIDTVGGERVPVRMIYR